MKEELSVGIPAWWAGLRQHGGLEKERGRVSISWQRLPELRAAVGPAAPGGCQRLPGPSLPLPGALLGAGSGERKEAAGRGGAAGGEQLLGVRGRLSRSRGGAVRLSSCPGKGGGPRRSAARPGWGAGVCRLGGCAACGVAQLAAAWPQSRLVFAEHLAPSGRLF